MMYVSSLFQKDKLKHFAITVAMVVFLFVITSMLWVSVSVALSIGLLKELWYDLWLKRGTPDIYDMVANILGALSAVLLICVWRIM